MRSSSCRALAVLATTLCLTLAACDDDDGSPLTRGLHGTVTDAAGEPVAGAAVSIFYDLPWLPGRAEQQARGAPSLPGRGPELPPFDLQQNRPNPFNPATAIRFHLAEACDASLEILDRHDRPVRLLVSGLLPSGTHEARWDGSDDLAEMLPNGWYQCRLQCRNAGTGDLLYAETVGGLFIDLIAIEAVAPVAHSDEDGRFFIPYSDLPLGLEVPFVDEAGNPIGDQVVGPDLQVQAILDGAYGAQDIVLPGGGESAFVTIQLASVR